MLLRPLQHFRLFPSRSLLPSPSLPLRSGADVAGLCGVLEEGLREDHAERCASVAALLQGVEGWMRTHVIDSEAEPMAQGA